MSVFIRPSPSCQIPHLNEIYEQYFSGLKDGTFVEVGANDGYSWSNTWSLAEIGWRGLYFEPVEALAQKCKTRHAKNNIAVTQAAVGMCDGETKLYLGEGCTTSPKVAKENTFHYGNSPDKFVNVPVISLNSALKFEGIKRNFELLVIDVDGDEIGVLDGLDLDIWQPKLIIIETCKDSKTLGWNFNAEMVESILFPYYQEVYHDHINSIYARRSKKIEGEKKLTSLFESKWRTLLKYGGWYGCVNFVETGTGHGDTLDILYPFFKQCHSIELSDELYRDAKAKFRNVQSIAIHHGDSGEELGKIVPSLKGTTLFYLDAHYCGEGTGRGSLETPIITELNAILKAPKFDGVILIDDLKNFGSGDYPTTLQLKTSLPDKVSFQIISDGGGMMAIIPAKKKPDLERKLIQVVPKVVTGGQAPTPEVQAPATASEHPRNFERPPMLYGPYRNPEKK